MTSPFSARRHVLLGLTGLVVAYVRRVVQYHQYSWDSIWQLLSWWFIHYIAIALLAGVAYFFIRRTEGFFFGPDRARPELQIDDVLVHVSIIVLVAAIAVFLLAHWVPMEGDE
jgi:uncharacterized membrane protein HdeD (DUF308 family)